MLKKIIGLLLIFLLSYGFFVVRALPATVVTSRFGELDQNVELGRSDGTLWQGTTEFLRYRGINLGRLSWDVDLFYVFVLKLFGHVSLIDNAGSITGSVSVSPTGLISVSDGRANLMVNSVLEKIEFDLVQAAGRISAQINSLNWDGQLVSELDGEVVWNNAEVTVTSKLLLGKLKLKLFNEGEMVVAEVIEGGRIGLQGKLMLEPDGHYKIAGSVAPSDDIKPDLAPVLAYLGRPNSSGRYAIKYNGRLR